MVSSLLELQLFGTSTVLLSFIFLPMAIAVVRVLDVFVVGFVAVSSFLVFTFWIFRNFGPHEPTNLERVVE